jgi:hypothetical protein
MTAEGWFILYVVALAIVLILGVALVVMAGWIPRPPPPRPRVPCRCAVPDTGWVKYRVRGVEHIAKMPATVTLLDYPDCSCGAPTEPPGAW